MDRQTGIFEDAFDGFLAPDSLANEDIFHGVGRLIILRDVIQHHDCRFDRLACGQSLTSLQYGSPDFELVGQVLIIQIT